MLNEALAAQLRARTGDNVILRARKPDALGADSPLAPQDESAAVLRLRVHRIISASELGKRRNTVAGNVRCIRKPGSSLPTAINGVQMPVVDLIASLGTIAGAHGVGRIDMVENRLVGIKSFEIYEAPAAVALHAAHRELQKLVTTKDLDRLSRFVGVQYADLVYNGLWFTPTREALDAFVEKVQERVTGVVRLKLFKGDCRIVGRKSAYALYDHALATYDAGDTYDHTAAVGFIKIWGLPVETAARKAPNRVRHSSVISVAGTK